MKEHYIPEDKFPIEIDKNIFILGNYFFNLFLIIGSKYSAIFEVGISGIVDTVIRQLEHLDINPDFIISSHPHSDHITGLPGLAMNLFEQSYKDEFTLYTPENIKNCMVLLVKRAKEAGIDFL